MPRTFIEAIGYSLGKKAAQAKNLFDLLGGDDEESLRAEIRLGRDMARAVLNRTPRAQDSEVTIFASQILRWLAGHVTEKKLPFALFITAEAAPNALALPGGPIFISWPLLELCEGQRDEIAFVLAHEMGHIVQRHPLNRIIKDATLSLLLQQSAGGRVASNWLSKATAQMLSRGFAKEDELSADTFAQNILKAAGAEPSAAVRFLQKTAAPDSRPGVPPTTAFFAGHPAVLERIANLRASNPI